MGREELAAILARAAASPHGLLLRTSDAKRFRRLFYPLRREMGLLVLSCRLIDTPEGNIQIEHKGGTTP